MSDLTLTTARPAPSLAALVARFSRWRGVLMIVLASACGFLAALVVAFMGWATSELHTLLFMLPANGRLSEQAALPTPALALVPLAGGAVVGASAPLATWKSDPPDSTVVGAVGDWVR